MKSLAGDALLSSFGYDVCYASDDADTVDHPVPPSDNCNCHCHSEKKWIELKPMDLSLLECTDQDCQITDMNPKECANPKDLNDAQRLSHYSDDGRLVVNSPFTLRKEDDQFGRKITFLRKSLTSNDTKPFATL